MSKPEQPAARRRREQRLKAIGETIAGLIKPLPPLRDVYTSHTLHVDQIARMTRIPVTSLRRIAEHWFQEIRVPGHVVGYDANRFYVALSDKSP